VGCGERKEGVVRKSLTEVVAFTGDSGELEGSMMGCVWEEVSKQMEYRVSID
jgi:hypothetical protein